MAYAYGALGQAQTFLQLTDTPDTYAGQAGLFVRVNSAETDLEFAVSAGAVTVHNILSASHTDTIAGTLVYGDVLVVNSSNKLTRLPRGTANKVLHVTSAGLGPQWDSTLAGLTLTTPTIASFTNAQHNHQNAAGGGTLSLTAAFTASQFSAAGSKLVRVNSGGTALEFAAIKSIDTMLYVSTADGADNSSLELCGGGASGNTRAAFVRCYGNEVATFGGVLILEAGNVATGEIWLQVQGVMAWKIDTNKALLPWASNSYDLGTSTKLIRDIQLGRNIVFPDGVRQTFNPDATVAGINVGSQAGDPSTPTNGDLWYDSTANELTARINGANVALIGSGGGTFTSIGETPDNYTSAANKVLRVNAGATAVEFAGVTLTDTIMTWGTSAASILMGTVDASDNAALTLAGGGGAGETRGASVFLAGNEYATAGNKGMLLLKAGSIYVSGNDGDIVLNTAGNDRWYFKYTGHLLPNLANTYDIGDATHQLRNLYVSTYIYLDGSISFPDNIRQIFNPGTNNAGLNVGSLAGDPSTPVNGDLWYDSTANELTARINGANFSFVAAVGANTALSNLASVAINGSLVPGAVSLNLGNTTWGWDQLFLEDRLTDPTSGGGGVGGLALVSDGKGGHSLKFALPAGTIKTITWT